MAFILANAIKTVWLNIFILFSIDLSFSFIQTLWLHFHFCMSVTPELAPCSIGEGWLFQIFFYLFSDQAIMLLCNGPMLGQLILDKLCHIFGRPTFEYCCLESFLGAINVGFSGLMRLLCFLGRAFHFHFLIISHF